MSARTFLAHVWRNDADLEVSVEYEDGDTLTIIGATDRDGNGVPLTDAEVEDFTYEAWCEAAMARDLATGAREAAMEARS